MSNSLQPYGLWLTRLLCEIPNSGIKPEFHVFPALAGRFCTTEPPGKTNMYWYSIKSYIFWQSSCPFGVSLMPKQDKPACFPWRNMTWLYYQKLQITQGTTISPNAIFRMWTFPENQGRCFVSMFWQKSKMYIYKLIVIGHHKIKGLMFSLDGFLKWVPTASHCWIWGDAAQERGREGKYKGSTFTDLWQLPPSWRGIVWAEEKNKALRSAASSGSSQPLHPLPTPSQWRRAQRWIWWVHQLLSRVFKI